MKICLPIHGIKHCFDIPELVDDSFFHRPPPPGNYPELELAGTILTLLDHIKPVVRDTEFTKALTDLSTKYIQKVREGLPKEVELSVMKVKAKEKTV